MSSKVFNACDLAASAKVIQLIDHESELAALREELANHDSASLLMNAWVTEHKSQMPWDKAIEMIAVVTKMPDAEKQRLLCLDDQYELTQQLLTAAEQRNAVLKRLLHRSLCAIRDHGHIELEYDICKALKPTESGASE